MVETNSHRAAEHALKYNTLLKMKKEKRKEKKKKKKEKEKERKEMKNKKKITKLRACGCVHERDR